VQEERRAGGDRGRDRLARRFGEGRVEPRVGAVPALEAGDIPDARGRGRGIRRLAAFGSFSRRILEVVRGEEAARRARGAPAACPATFTAKPSDRGSAPGVPRAPKWALPTWIVA
jgi:hypothetical protein